MNGSDMDESENLAFVVKRRQQDADTGQTATFTVRVETDRSGPDLALDDWTEDGDTERVYRDYPLELTGTDLEITKQYQITNNGESETNWGFSFSDDIEKYRLVHFMVTRRAQDVGQTSTFVVRVEHDRGWEIPRHADWPTHPVSGKHYKEFPLTLTGDQRTVVGGIEILDNGLIDPENWMYSAQIKPLGDTDGNPLTAGQEAQYWTATGRCPLVPSESHKVQVDITNVTPEPVVEGQQVTFTIHRNRGNPLEPLTVHLRTWEPNRRMADGTNHTEQIHDLTFPALSMTSDWVEYVTQTMALTVTTEDAPKSETRDVLRAEMFRRECDLYQNYDHHRFKNEVHDRRVEIEDNDRPTITLSADKRAATEGETGFGEQVGAQPKVGMRAQKSGKGPISSVVDGCL